MSKFKFAINVRFANFWSNFKAKDFVSTTFLGYSLGWLLTLILVTSFLNHSFLTVFLIFLLHGYFVVKIIREIQKRITPPIEFLLALNALLLLLEVFYLRSEFAASIFWNPVISKFQIQIPILQSLLLANLVLSFGLILVQNSQGKIKYLLWLVLFGALSNTILNDGGAFSILLFQALLFLLLLRKTSWLDALTKIECWIYLFVLIIIFQGAIFLNPYQELKTQLISRGLVWYTLPYYLFLLFKMYLLALLVKIPVVLVYNHAQLSRKLRISSLFQSTFPQVTHLVMLLVILYLFIAVWKAENIRQAFIQQIEEIKSGTAPKSLTYYKVKIDSSSSSLPISGYQPINYSRPLPELGVMTLTLDMTDKLSVPGKDDYFYFFRPLDSEPDSIYFIKFNSKLLKVLNQKTSIVAATKLVAYPYTLGQWESFLFNRKILVDDSTIRLFPFGLISQNRENSISFEVEAEPKTGSATHDKDSQIAETSGSLKKPDNYEFVLGRVLIPNYNANLTQNDSSEKQ